MLLPGLRVLPATRQYASNVSLRTNLAGSYMCITSKNPTVSLTLNRSSHSLILECQQYTRNMLTYKRLLDPSIHILVHRGLNNGLQAATVLDRKHLGLLSTYGYLTHRNFSTCGPVFYPRKSTSNSQKSTEENSGTSKQSTENDEKSVEQQDTIDRNAVNVPVVSKEQTTESEKKLSVFQRFKQAYKDYGYTLIGVEIVTSVMWFSGIYLLIQSGVDLVPLLMKIGTPEAILKKLTETEAGNLAVAFIFYKIIAPVRYALVLGLTQLIVKMLRKRGYMKAPSKEDSIRNLMKEGQSAAKQRYSVSTQKMRTRIESGQQRMRDRIKTRRQTLQQNFDSRTSNIRSRIAARRRRGEEVTGQVRAKAEQVKDKAEYLKDTLKSKSEQGLNSARGWRNKGKQ